MNRVLYQANIFPSRFVPNFTKTFKKILPEGRFVPHQSILKLMVIVWLLSAGAIIAEDEDSPLVKGEESTESRQSGEEIGTVGLEKVYKNQLDSTGNSPIVEELHKLFFVPTLEKYYEMHKKDLMPTEKEISNGTQFLTKFLAENEDKNFHPKLKPLFLLKAQIDEFKKENKTKSSNSKRAKLEQKIAEVESKYKEGIRKFTLYKTAQIKLQHHIYVQYGAGRILTQNGDDEAFDATHRWIADRGRRNAFKITNEEFKKNFYSYWTKEDQWTKLRGTKYAQEKNAFQLKTLGLPALKGKKKKSSKTPLDIYPKLDIAGTWLKTDMRTGKQSIVRFESSDNKTYKLSGAGAYDGEFIQDNRKFKETTFNSKTEDHKTDSQSGTEISWSIENKNLLLFTVTTRQPKHTHIDKTDPLIRLNKKNIKRLVRQFKIKANLSTLPNNHSSSEGKGLAPFQGKWIMMFKKSGYLRMVEFRMINQNQIELHGAGNLKGIFEKSKKSLVEVSRKKLNPHDYEWAHLNLNLLILFKCPPSKLMGSDYTGNLMVKITDELVEKLD